MSSTSLINFHNYFTDMSVEFTKNQRNNSVACSEGYSYFFVKKSKKDPNISFYTCEKYWDKDFKCLAKVNLIQVINFSLQTIKYLKKFKFFC